MQLNESIAQSVAGVERQLEEIAEKHTAAVERRNSLTERQRKLEAEREKIIERRAQGDVSEDQEARLVVIDADLRGLAPLVERATAEAAAIEPELTVKRELLARVQTEWVQHQHVVRHAQIQERVKEIEGLLIQAVAECHQAGVAAGRPHLQQNWTPSNELTRLVRNRALPGQQGALAPLY